MAPTVYCLFVIVVFPSCEKQKITFKKGEITEGGLVVERDHLESSNAFLVFWNFIFF